MCIRDREQAKAMRLVRHGARRDDDQIGDLTVGDVRLRAVDHPVIAAILGACLHPREIAASARLSHRDGQDALARDTAWQEALLLLLVADLANVRADEP